MFRIDTHTEYYTSACLSQCLLDYVILTFIFTCMVGQNQTKQKKGNAPENVTKNKRIPSFCRWKPLLKQLLVTPIPCVQIWTTVGPTDPVRTEGHVWTQSRMSITVPARMAIPGRTARLVKGTQGELDVHVFVPQKHKINRPFLLALCFSRARLRVQPLCQWRDVPWSPLRLWVSLSSWLVWADLC